jgi:outer membrane receptor protein involved in Fe transport
VARVPQYPDDSIYDRAGVFLNWDVYITPNLNASVGTRSENNNVQTTPNITINNVPTDVFFEQTYNDWVGSAGLTYHLTDEINLVGGFYEGYRAPTLDDLVSTTTFLQNAQSNPQLANLGLVPEHSYTYEVGVKMNADRLRLEVYQWWMEIDDYITREVDGAGNVILGNHQARLYGTEAVGEYLLPCGWAAYGNFAYTFGNDLTDGVPYTRIPPIQSVAGLRWRDDCRRSYFDVFTWMVGRQDRYNPVNLTDSRFWVNGVPATPGFMTLNLRAGTRLWACDQHRVSLSLENITDRFYRVLGSGVDGPGLGAIFGYEYYR